MAKLYCNNISFIPFIFTSKIQKEAKPIRGLIENFTKYIISNKSFKFALSHDDLNRLTDMGSATPAQTPITKKSRMIMAGTFAVAFALASVLMFSNSASTTIAQVEEDATTTATTTNVTKPVDGYDAPEGYLTAVRHVFDDPSLRVHHYCKPNDPIMLVCQLYDGKTANSTLIGIEYIITQEQYDSLPDREKPNWHYHEEEFRPDRADAMMPELSPQQAAEVMEDLSTTWGKVIITWNPNDDMPSFPPQVQQVDHPFMVNATVEENTTDEEE
jgi:hypothetical protein